MDVEFVVDLLFSVLPIFIMAIVFFIISIKTKRNYDEKLKNVTKATVVSVKVEESRNKDGYLNRNRYILELSYLCDGNYVTREYYSIYEYEVDSIIDIEVVNGNIKSILSNPPKEGMEKIINLKGYRILRYISIFLFVFSGLSCALNIIDYFRDEYIFLECLVLIGVILVIYCFLNKKRGEYESKYKLIKSGGYSTIMGIIVDIKVSVKYKDRRRYEYYYPIVEYQDGYKVCRKVIYNNISKGYDKLGSNLLIYKNRNTGEVLSENDVEFINLKAKILKWVNVFLLISIVFSIIYYL